MAEIIGTYNLRPAVKGDTWDGVTLIISTDGTADDLTGYTIEMKVEQPGSNTASKSLTTEDSGGITITDAEAGTFKIDSFLMDLQAGDYEYRIILIDGDERRKTRVKGNWKIIEV
jgi:hypothetical protein